MRIEWTPSAVATARRHMADQDGMRSIGAAVAALADDPYPPPPDGFHRGRYHRLRVGPYRIMYVIDDVITVERVDRLPPHRQTKSQGPQIQSDTARRPQTPQPG